MDGRFESFVLEWLLTREPDASFVRSVRGHGSDWDGDTEGGFFSTFSVDVDWIDRDGRARSMKVEGEEMQSLWEHVIGAPVPSRTG